MSNCKTDLANLGPIEKDPVFLAQKGQPGGVPTLDANGKVPLSQIDIKAVFTERDPVYLADRGAPYGIPILDGQGLVVRDQLGTGITDGTTVLFSDGVWRVPPSSGGGGGTSGFSGVSGKSGFSGYSGIGNSGFSGFSGYSGIGNSGFSGFSGISGGIGASGYSGANGSDNDLALLPLDGSRAMTGALDMGSPTNGDNPIHFVTDPINPQDAATKNYVDTHGGSGITAAESMLLKSFFSNHGLLPVNTHFEDLYTFPALDFQNLSGGSFDTQMSRQEFVPVGAGPINYGWDIGSLKSEILMIFGMFRIGGPSGPGSGGVPTVSTNLNSLFFSSVVPSAGELPDGSYAFFADSPAHEFEIYKKTAGNYSLIAQEVDVSPGINISEASMAIAFYYNSSTNRLVGLGRFGSECWFPIIDTTDATFSTMRYVGARYNWSGGTPVSWAGCPIAIYTN